MGYQQSLVQFKSMDDMRNQLLIYKHREKKHDMVDVYSVVKCVKGISEVNLRKGAHLVVIGGERYDQRSLERLTEATGFRAKRIFFVDNPIFWELSGGNISEFLDSHFLELSKEEMEAIKINIDFSEEEGEEGE